MLYTHHFPWAVRNIFSPTSRDSALSKGAHAVLQGLLAAILRLAVGSQNLGFGNVREILGESLFEMEELEKSR